MPSYRNNPGWSKATNIPRYQKIRAGLFDEIKTRLRAFPLSLSHDVAQRSAPVLTALARQSFDSGTTVYGDARPESVEGKALTLRRTGETARTIAFIANGTIVRCVLGTKYARYLIGKYAVLPNGRAAPPVAWTRAIGEVVAGAKGP
jgi:hypothetical protein